MQFFHPILSNSISSPFKPKKVKYLKQIKLFYITADDEKLNKNNAGQLLWTRFFQKFKLMLMFKISNSYFSYEWFAAKHSSAGPAPP